MQKFNVAVIGGGASGLACAVALKKYDSTLSVVIVESGDRLGRKIAASGNGQGNVSNADLSPAHWHGSGAYLAEKLCSNGGFSLEETFGFLFVQDKLGRIYPASKQGSCLSDCLIRKAERAGVCTILSKRVTSVKRGFEITLEGGEKLTADYVVLAAGGKAQKQFGTNGDSYAIASSLGHKITPLYPALVQLKCDARNLKTLKGIRAECGVTAYDGAGNKLVSTTGDVIFTDYGLSGNAIFYVSSYCAGRADVTLSLAFLPSVEEGAIARNVRAKIEEGYPREELLCGTLHNQIGRAVIKRCQSADPEEIAHAVKNFTVKVEGSLGFDYAQVTKGGVEASSVTDGLESKLCPRLYIVGEALDVDGDCGGYNLTWAFASGIHAAKNIVREEGGDD